jgi:hypothetical protein
LQQTQQNLQCQQQMTVMSQEFRTLAAAQKAMHGAIMAMLNSTR